MYICKEHEELMQNCTTIIESSYYNDNIGHGTGFFYKSNTSKILLITNKHVMTKSKCCKIYITVNDLNKNIICHITLEIKLKNTIRFHESYDLCAVNITDVYNDLVKENRIPQFKFIENDNILLDYSDLQLVQDVIMVGYPSGLIDIVNNKPIIRTGTVATNINNRYNGKEIFLIDVATFKGSSGSPIFTLNNDGELFLLGINSECLNHNTRVNKKKKDQLSRASGYVDIPNNLGVIINSKIVADFLSI